MSSGRYGIPAVPLHIHAVLSGVMSPFLSFLGAVLSHYQIHVLHLDPTSLVLLSAFAFLGEAFLGVAPSMALLRHVFSLKSKSVEQCSGCMSFEAADTSVRGALGAELLPEAEGFHRQWVQVVTVKSRALFQPPSPATPNRGWMREELDDPRLMTVLTRLESMKRVGVTMAMVVLEFICRRISPLQRHSRPMWAYIGPRDPMMFHIIPLSSDVLCELLRRLTGSNPDELPENGLPLYNFKSLESLVMKMSLFDEWGFLPRKEVAPGGFRPLWFRLMGTLAVSPLPQLEWAMRRRMHPRPSLAVEPGSMVANGRCWRLAALPSGFGQGPPSPLARPPMPTKKGGRPRAAAPKLGELGGRRSGSP
ncbi:hypothetical protein D1007_33418 [Hordeum vulgare]|nr:hypothetical protein D1007_33418 [Hordeum vulgare]